LPDDLRALRRGQIVAAARAIVARDGLEALTVGALEEELGYSRGVITYHFKNKDEIVEALLTHALDEIDQATRTAVAAATTTVERAHAVIGAVVRGFLGHAEAVRIMVAFWGRLHSDQRIRAANAALYARYRRQTAEVLGGSPENDALATVIVGVVLGIAAQHYFDPDSVDVEAAVAEASRAVESRLRASAPRLVAGTRRARRR
jgi:AcrR family transcriptional regulator